MDNEFNNLSDFVNQSEEFKSNFEKTLINVWKEVLTPASLKEYITDECQKELTYDNIYDTLLIDVQEYFAPDVGDKINLSIKIPEDIFLSADFIDELIDVMGDDSCSTEIDNHYFQVMNALLLPLMRERVKVLKEADDAVGDKHDFDIDIIDIQNREKPFLIVRNKVYFGQDLGEHGQISDELLEKGIDDQIEPIVVGHVIDGIGFIDLGRTINPEKISKEKIKEIIDNEPKLMKAYTTPVNQKVTRLAKKI